MTSKEFVVWMQGFVEACNEYSPTPKQWDTLKDKLGEVKDEPTHSIPFGVPNTAPSIWQHPHYVDPYKITNGTDTTLTVSSGSSGTIIATPGYGSITYNPSSTTYAKPQSGSWHYTSTLPQQPTTGSNQLELEFETK
jgi:hypothetical protein